MKEERKGKKKKSGKGGMTQPIRLPLPLPYLLQPGPKSLQRLHYEREEGQKETERNEEGRRNQGRGS